MAKWKNELYCKLQLTMVESAPLLLTRLKAHATVPIAGYAGWFDGQALITLLKAERNVANATEEDHEIHDLVMEVGKRLIRDATAIHQ